MRTLTLVLFTWTAGALAAQTPTADELLARLDRQETSASSHAVGTITVTDRFGTKVTGFESWTRGRDQSLTAFTSGDEKGQKILRLQDTLYVGYPEADKPVKIQGAALKDSVAGSDLSYEDLAGDRSLAGRYTPKIVGAEPVAGEDCTVLELTARRPGLAYPLLRIWVADDGAGRKVEKYALGGRLLKTQEVLAVTRTAGRTVPTKVRMTDALKTRSSTVFEIRRQELDAPVDPARFRLEELGW